MRETLLRQLDETIEAFCDLYRALQDPGIEVYEGWTARDVLAHLTFWHESFARNTRDLAISVRPTPLKGTYAEINQRCFQAMRPLSGAEIMDRFQAAQKMIREHILSEKVQIIPYRKGSRDYSPEEHLEIVSDHIRKHMQDVEKIL